MKAVRGVVLFLVLFGPAFVLTSLGTLGMMFMFSLSPWTLVFMVPVTVFLFLLGFAISIRYIEHQAE